MKITKLSLLGFLGLGAISLSAFSQRNDCLFGNSRNIIVEGSYKDLIEQRRNYEPKETDLNPLERKVLQLVFPGSKTLHEGGFITFKSKQNKKTYIAVDLVDNGYLDIFDAKTLKLVGQTDHGQMDICKVSFTDKKSLPFFYEKPEYRKDIYDSSVLGLDLLELARMKRFDFSLSKREKKDSPFGGIEYFYDMYQMHDLETGERYRMRINLTENEKVISGNIDYLGSFPIRVATIGKTGVFTEINIRN